MDDAQLRAAITAASFSKLESEGRLHRCGGCIKWMTKGCPQEKLGGDGYNRGPSYKAIACCEFVATAGVAGASNGEDKS